MREVSKNLLIILGGILVLAVGVGLGLGLNIGFCPEAVAPKSALENKVIQSVSVSVSGKVVKIEDQEITLEHEGDSLSFTVAEDTQISRFEMPTIPEGEVVPEELPLLKEEKIALEDIKVGNQVSAFLEQIAEGKFVARNISVSSE